MYFSQIAQVWALIVIAATAAPVSTKSAAQGSNNVDLLSNLETQLQSSPSLDKRAGGSGIERQPHECKTCSEPFGSRGVLEQHMIDTNHGGLTAVPMKKGKLQTCSTCFEPFGNNAAMERHLLDTNHGGLTAVEKTKGHLYSCRTCQAPFSNKQRLKDHVQEDH